MSGVEVTSTSGSAATSRRWLRRCFRSLFCGAALFCSLDLLTTGSVHADGLRAYAFAWGLVAAGTGLLVDRPDLEQERRRRPSDAVEPTFHFYLMAALVAWNLVAPPLDARFGLSSIATPSVLRWPALTLVVLGGWLAAWAVHANPFYSLYIRNQKHRGHSAVTAGPYRWLRHPAYAGMFLTNLACPFAGGSYLGLLGAVPYIAILIRRTLREDRWATSELPGYALYAGAVRWKLLPGIW